KGYLFEKDIEQIVFDGFLKILNPDFAARHATLPSLTVGDSVKLQQAENEEGFTKAPPRYNDGSLVRTLEEKGIGRPSTYASIIGNIQDKHYVVREKNQFVPTALGTAVSEYLSEAFSKILELDFTANMEAKLDLVEENEEDVVTMLDEFYKPFKSELDVRKQDMSAIEVEPDLLDEKCPQCDSQLTYKYGKFGKFTACSNYPACKYIKKIIKYLEGQNCPQCQGRLVYRFAPKQRRRFFGCENYPTCKYTQFTLKPKEDAPKPSSSEQQT
ncbi:topoisomerase DNA-binding C4 zinc finger domain-containing protein, partial [Candidatus Woesebacteria bacterium]|nr:topoisomerase DNA-binding C4 zinc finger domain-containing protein [Candidatus Woesebacteria bacterium]